MWNSGDEALAGAFNQSDGGQLPTAELVRALSAAGLSPICTHNLISLSPLLRQVRLGVQELRGTQSR